MNKVLKFPEPHKVPDHMNDDTEYDDAMRQAYLDDMNTWFPPTRNPEIEIKTSGDKKQQVYIT